MRGGFKAQFDELAIDFIKDANDEWWMVHVRAAVYAIPIDAQRCSCACIVLPAAVIHFHRRNAESAHARGQCTSCVLCVLTTLDGDESTNLCGCVL